MPVYPKLNLVFIHVPKTAGGAIEELLLPYKASGKKTVMNRLLRHLPMRRDINSAYIPGHATAIEVKCWMGPELWDSYQRFAVVRNPYDRVISAYEFERQTPRHHRHARVNAMRFEDYAKSYASAQSNMLCDAAGQLIVPRLIRFEGLHDALDILFEELGIPERLARQGDRNSSEKKPRDQYLTEEALDLINTRCARDFDVLGYDRIG